jgi:hypothetical protein
MYRRTLASGHINGQLGGKGVHNAWSQKFMGEQFLIVCRGEADLADPVVRYEVIKAIKDWAEE